MQELQSNCQGFSEVVSIRAGRTEKIKAELSVF